MDHQIIHGIDKLSQIVKASNCSKLFIVVGSSFFRQNIKSVVDSLDCKKVYFSDYTPNPLYEQVCKGIDLLKTEKCDAILAVGGGSAIDVAKCIKLAVLASVGNDSLIPPLVNTRVACDGSELPFIAIPTTAGTGSESTHNAVMYYEGAKQTVTNDSVLPDFAILEPSVLKTLPLYQKKCTMMDALCQGIESWWSVNSTEESYEYSKKTIELIMQNWEAYILDDDSKAAGNIMLGANYSGRAINITATTAAHAMSYKLTSLYEYPHGHAVACCLPLIWRYMQTNLNNGTAEVIDTRGTDYLKDIFSKIAATMGCNTIEDAISHFEDMMIRMGLKQPVLSSPDELNILANSVNPERLKNNPVYLSEKALRSLYEEITK